MIAAQTVRKALGLIALAVFIFPPGIARLGIATELDYLSSLEQGVVTEINLARTNPSGYAEHLIALRPYFNGRRFERPGKVAIITKEGVAAVDEAIRFLRATKPISQLVSSRGMSMAAKDHAKDQERTGKTSHTGRDGSQPWDRINRYGTWQGKVGENISYGDDNARAVVTSLLVDDGVPSRGHRTNLFDPIFHIVGIGCAPHPKYRTACVITMAGGFNE